jgi:hypothetical protein
MSSDQESISNSSCEYDLNNENNGRLSESSSEENFNDEITESSSVSTSETENESSESDDESSYNDNISEEISSEEDYWDGVLDEYYSNYYEPEEISRTKYNVVLCELYNSKKHGNPEVNSLVEYHYITHGRFKRLNNNINIDIRHAIFYNRNFMHEFIPHNIFRNYEYILSREDLIRPEIAECLYLSGGECVSILKTFWIRIIQRKWKKIVIERNFKIELRKKLSSLLYRETNGRWPSSCLYLPSLKGMLSGLA